MTKYLDSQISVIDGNWHHVAGTYDGNQMRIYIDKQLTASKSQTGSPDFNTTSIMFGYTVNGYYLDGTIDEVHISNVARDITDVKQSYIVPTDFVLFQNFPNPFNPTTTVKYELPKKSFVRITLYDLLSREIKTLVNEEKDAGYHEIQFNSGDIASGVYFYRMEAGKYFQTKKMVLIK